MRAIRHGMAPEGRASALRRLMLPYGLILEPGTNSSPPEKSGAFVVSVVREERSRMRSRLINGVIPSVPRILSGMTEPTEPGGA